MKIQCFILYKVTTQYENGDTRITNAAVPVTPVDVTYELNGGANLVRERMLASQGCALNTTIENMGTVEVITDN